MARCRAHVMRRNEEEEDEEEEEEEGEEEVEQGKTEHTYHAASATNDTLAEWLRRRPAKPMGFPRVGSNPTGVDCLAGCRGRQKLHIARCALRLACECLRMRMCGSYVCACVVAFVLSH